MSPCIAVLGGMLLLGQISAYAQTSPAFSVRGRVTTSFPAKSIRIVAEDPKAKGVMVAEATADEEGNYELSNLTLRAYRVIAWIDGKKQDSRNLEILCRPGNVMKKSFFYGKNEPAFTFYFPLEDPDVADVQEVQSGVSAAVMKEYSRATEEYANRNMRGAVQRLEALLVKAPNFYGLHTRLGMIYEQSGCYTDAETEFSRAGELSPRSSQPLLNLARAQIQGSEGMPDEQQLLSLALDNVSRALALKPTSAVAHCLAGTAYERSSSVAEAERSFKQALELDSEMPAARLMLACLYMHQKKWMDSLENLEAYLQDHPSASDRVLVKSLMSDVADKMLSSESF
jgi:Flp pilus assembly protein TadD